MSHLRPHLPTSPLDWLCRSFWLGLIGLHLMPSIAIAHRLASTPTWESLGEAFILVLALLYFATKVLGVQYVRFHCRWSAVLAFAVICGLAHAEVRRSVMPDALPPAIVLATSTAILATALSNRRLLARAHKLISGAASEQLAALCRATWWSRVLEPDLSPHLRQPCLIAASNRGPPAC